MVKSQVEVKPTSETGSVNCTEHTMTFSNFDRKVGDDLKFQLPIVDDEVVVV